MSDPTRQQPCETLAIHEEHRAAGLAERIHEIKTWGDQHPSQDSLPLYEAARQNALDNAAAARTPL